MPYAIPMPPETDPFPLDYALQRLLEGMAADDVQEAAFWLGVLAACGDATPPGGSVH
jgi:hypothetical protein